MGYQDWRTPKEFFQQLDQEFHFTVDVAADSTNALCSRYYDLSHNGLKQSWANEVVWCNPPYFDVYPWVEKAATESMINGATVVMLLNPATDTTWFHTFIWDTLHHRSYPNVQVRFLQGRIQFLDKYNLPAGAPIKGNMLVVFRPSKLSK